MSKLFNLKKGSISYRSIVRMSEIKDEEAIILKMKLRDCQKTKKFVSK